MARITIMGGHGKVALRLSQLLADQGHEVRSWIRNPDQSDDVRKTGATPVVLDLEQSSVEQMAAQLQGQDAVVWSAGAGGGNPPRTYAVDRDAAIRSMEAAEQAGVKRYVMVSYIGSRPDHGVPPDDSFFPYAEAKAAADEALRKSKLDWTILGPGRLTLDEPSGRITVDPPKEASTDTSRANVALVIAAALREPKTIRATIDFVDGDTPIVEALQGL